MRAYTVRFATPTSAGTLDLTVSGAGTCIGATFKVSGALADVTPTNSARMGYGATDGTNSRCGSFVSFNGQVNTASRRYKNATNCITLLNTGGSLNGTGDFNSFIADGIRLDMGAWGNAFLGEAVLYFDDGGDDFYVGTASTVPGDDTVSSVGFEATFLHGFSTYQASPGSTDTNAKFSMGFALNDGTQSSLNFYEAHNVADGAPSARVDSAYFLRDIENSSVNGAVQIGSFTSSGFTATQINGSGFEFYFVAVKCSNVVTLDLELSRSSTGSRSHTGPGGPPQFVYGWNSKIDTLDSNFENGRAGAFGFWQAHSTSVQYNSAVAIEDASTTTDCQSTTDNAFPHLPDHDGGTTTAIIGSITAFHATGITIDYTTVDSVECYFALLAIHLEDVFVTPSAGDADFLGVNPTAVLGSLVLDGGDGIATFLGVNPTTHQGSLALTPAAASVSFVGTDPTVDTDEDAIKATMTAYETRTGNNFLFGTLPVPDSWVETDLALRDPDTGSLLPTMQEVVEYGPTGNPRVLELRSYANSDGVNPKTYKVEEATALSGLSFGANIRIDIQADAPLSEASPGTIAQFSSRMLQEGASVAPANAVAHTQRASGELQASGGNRLFGYEAFITTIAGEDGVWLVDMTVHNGNVGTPGSPLGSGALHDVFFNEIRLAFSVGGSPSTDYAVRFLHPTPYAVNATRKLMQPNGDGSDHCIQQGQAHEYRFAVYHTSKLARATVLLDMRGFMVADFSKTKWSWSNRNTAHFGPAGTLVAEFNVSGHLPYQQNWTPIKDALAFGNPVSVDSATSKPAGPFHLGGFQNLSQSSGNGIYGHVGHEVINATITRLDRLNTLIAVQGMLRDRMASKEGKANGNFLRGICIVDNSQNPIDAAQWDLSNVVAFYPGEVNAPGEAGPFSRYLASNWRFLLASSEGSLPSYYGDITSYGPPNFSHFPRALNATFPLIWLKNDRLAKSYLATFAAWARMRVNEYGKGDLYNQWIDGLNNNSNPGKGLGGFGGRYGGWPILALAADYKVSSTSKRANYLPWYEQNNDAHERGQLPSGNWHASGTGDTPENNLDHQWTVVNGYPPVYDGGVDAAASQAIEIGIHGYGMLAWRDALGSATLQTLLNDSCRGLWEYHWMPGAGAPHFVAPVRPESSKLLPAWTTRYPGTGDPNGTLGGIAPDCFTKPPFQSPDNYQIAPLILAGLRGDPSDVNAWNAIYDVLGVSTVEDAIVDLQDMATNDELKWCAGWNAVMALLQDVLDNTFVIPVAGVVVFGGRDPTLHFGSTTASPAAGSASFLGVDPTVFGGGRITVDPAVFTAGAADPTVVVGNVSVTPAAAAVSMLGVSPTIVLDSTTATPAAGSASFLGVDPTVTLGSRTAASEPAIAEFFGVNPTVIVGNVAVTPTAAVVSFIGDDPVVVYVSFTYTPAAAVVSFLAEDPLVGQSVAVVPAPGSVTFLAVDPIADGYSSLLSPSKITLSGSISTVLKTLRGRV